jgi:hypothetical protein
MKAPLIMHVSIIAEAVPFVLGMLLPSRQTEARRWLMLWSALDTITNLAGSYLGRHHLHNLFLGYFYTPVEGAILMWMLAFWHPDPGTRRRLRWGIPAMVAGWVLLVMLFEDPQSFSRIVDLAYNVLMTSLFLHLLVRRSADDTTLLQQQDWFWISCGFAIHFAIFVAFHAVAPGLLNSNMETLMLASEVRAGLNVLACSFIAVGMTCRPNVDSEPGGLSPVSADRVSKMF